jgi:hypothetical protein
VTRAVVWIALAASMAIGACAGVTPPPGAAGTGGTAGPVTGLGGGAGHISGMGGMGVVIGVGGSMCGHQVFNVDRKPVEIFLVLDQSASMKEDSLGNKPTDTGFAAPDKWTQLIPALTQVIGAADATISWGMKAFPEGAGAACAATTVTTKIDVAMASGNAAAIKAGVAAATDNGNGTPTGPVVGVVSSYLQSLPDTNRKFILLATDGQPSCGGALGSLTTGTTAAKTDAVAAVAAAAAVGIHTFVVGVATAASDAMTLNLMAVAGMEPRNDPRPGADSFYLGTTQQELVSALAAIVNPIASSCIFPLTSVPPVPDNIAVKVNGTKSPQDTAHANGWDYTDPNYTAVQVYGPWCDMIKSNGNSVEITFGCKNEIIP